MTRRGMLVDLRRCVGCGACVVACQQANNLGPGVAWVRLDVVEWGEVPGESGRVVVPRSCMHCDEPACHAACPAGASVLGDDGVVAVDSRACIGCGACVAACPHGARVVGGAAGNYFHAEHPAPYEVFGGLREAGAGKCVFCRRRLDEGLLPACVANCPGKARFFGDLDDPDSPVSRRIAKGDALRVDGTAFYYVPVRDMPEKALPAASIVPAGERSRTGTHEPTADAGQPASAGQLLPAGRPTPPEQPLPVKQPTPAERHTSLKQPLPTKQPTPPEQPLPAVEKRHTICDMCNQVPFCGLTAWVQDGKVVRVESRDPHPVSPLCAKGLASIQELYDPARLLHPMRRVNPKGERSQWERISWDEAYATIARELDKAKRRHGAESVLFFCGDPKEPRAPLCRLAALFGSPTLGFESSLCATATQMAHRLVYGLNLPGFGAPPTDDTASCIIWSLNAAWSQPNRHASLMRQKERGCKFVVVDPRITPTVTSLADVHLQPRPGTDGALALGFINLLIRDGLYDAAFVEEWTHGFAGLAKLAAEYPPERVEAITWVPAAKLEQAVALVAESLPCALLSSSAGLTHTANAGHAQRAVFMIPALLGMVDVRGGQYFPAPRLSVAGNALGRGSTPEFRMEKVLNSDDFKSRRHDKDDFPAWHRLNAHLQTARLPEYIAEGKIRAAVLVGANTMMWPESSRYRQAIAQLDFSVAIDYFERPWTHDGVDIILPAAMSFERRAPFACHGRRIYLREPVVEPAGEAREDWRILLELGCALGFEEECFGGSVERALENVLVTGGLDIGLDELREHAEEGFLVPGQPAPERKYAAGLQNGRGTPGFATPTGKVEFDSELLRQCGFEGLPVYEEPPFSPFVDSAGSMPPQRGNGAGLAAAEFPLVLNTGSRVPFYTHSKLRDISWLRQFMPEPVVRLHPRDARARGIANGDAVRVFNRLGEVHLKAELTNMVLPGVVDAFHGWHQANINELIPRVFDPITGYPPFRAAWCEVARAK